MTTNSPWRPWQRQPSSYSDREAPGNLLPPCLPDGASDGGATDDSAAWATSVPLIEGTRRGSAENVVIEDRGALAARRLQVDAHGA
jgi:hypothetical protein